MVDRPSRDRRQQCKHDRAFNTLHTLCLRKSTAPEPRNKFQISCQLLVGSLVRSVCEMIRLGRMIKLVCTACSSLLTASSVLNIPIINCLPLYCLSPSSTAPFCTTCAHHQLPHLYCLPSPCPFGFTINYSTDPLCAKVPTVTFCTACPHFPLPPSVLSVPTIICCPLYCLSPP